mmetsp:Transcript_130288/g.364581  ORF Transcript_130288/g.364581 Transcript_130288/m.364581 type:complete len:421 (+) Transcript_130288:100-1362(+)
MGASSATIRTRCVYGCASGGPSGCASEAGFDAWLVGELHQAILSQDVGKLRELASFAPAVKDRAFAFPDEDYPMTALALALQRRDHQVVRALLEAGVSPNLPICREQREVYAHRSQLAALNGGDPDLQNLVPGTHFEALCATQHKDMFMLLLERSANPNSGTIQVSYCGDLEMLEALLDRSAEPNLWQRGSTPLMSAVKSKIQPHDKVAALLRVGADPNSMGPATNPPSSAPSPFASPASASTASVQYPPLTLATRKRDYRMVRILLEAGADVNQVAGDEGLPNALFWATYWGELEMVKLFVSLSRHRLDFDIRKYTNETVFDVARTSKSFAAMRKPRYIAKLPLPSRPPVVYDKISQLLEEYRAQYPEAGGDMGSRDDRANPAAPTGASSLASGWPLTGSTTATRANSNGEEFPASGTS